MSPTAISAGATALPETMPRRTILTGLMATAAALAVTVPAARARAAESPDAELIAIGRELVALYEQHAALNERVWVTQEEWDRIFDEKPEALHITPADRCMFGAETARGEAWHYIDVSRLTPITAPREHPGMTDPVKAAARVAEIRTAAQQQHDRLGAYERDSGRNALIGEMEEISKKAAPLERRAMCLRATTVAGFAVKAMMATEYLPDLWSKDPAALDYDQEIIRSLIEDFQAAAPAMAVQS